MRKLSRDTKQLIMAVVIGLMVAAVLYCPCLVLYSEREERIYGAEEADLAQMKALSGQCEAYKADNGEWPPNLEALLLPKAKNGIPYVENRIFLSPKSLPSGQFQYDPAGPHHQGTMPDIWLQGRHGQIGNWMRRAHQ